MEKRNQSERCLHCRIFSILLFVIYLLTFPSYAQTDPFMTEADSNGAMKGAPDSLRFVPAGYGGGGRYTAFAVEPGNTEIIYVGSDVAGLFKSNDNGKSFHSLGSNLTGFAVADMAINPHAPEEIAILLDTGLFFSEDGGNTFQEVSAQLHYNTRELGNKLLLFDNQDLIVATLDQGIFRVLRGNLSWKTVPLGLSGRKINALSQREGVLYVATAQGVLQRSKTSWSPVNEGLATKNRDIMDIQALPSGDVFLVERSTGIYHRHAHKGRWRHLGPDASFLKAQSILFKSMAIDPKNSNKLLLATHPDAWPHRLFLTENRGVSWQAVDSFDLTQGPKNWEQGLESVERIVASSDGSSYLIADWWNVWKSEDGKHWRRLHKGLQNTIVWDIALRQDKPGMIYVAASDNGLMVSMDDGVTWNRRMHGVRDGHGQSIALGKSNPDIVYLLMNPWEEKLSPGEKTIFVYKSTDAGQTWKEFLLSMEERGMDKPYVDGLAKSLRISPSDDHTIFVAVSGYGVYNIETANHPGGRITAQNISANLSTPYFWGSQSLLIHPENPEIIWTATLEGGVYRSDNGGSTWQATMPHGTFSYALAMDPNNPSLLVCALAEKQALLSEDGGKTWWTSTLPGERPQHVHASAVAFDPSLPGVVYLGTNAFNFKSAEGLFLSRDMGKTFAIVKSDLPRVGINALFHGRGRDLLIGFNGLGLFGLQSQDR